MPIKIQLQMENSDHVKSVFNKSQGRNPTKCKPEIGFKISKKEREKRKERQRQKERKKKLREALVETSPCSIYLYTLFSLHDLPPFSLLKTKITRNAIIRHLQKNNPQVSEKEV